VAPQGHSEPVAHILALAPISQVAAEVDYAPDSMAYSDPAAWASQILQGDINARAKQWSAAEVVQFYVGSLSQQQGRLEDIQTQSNDSAEARIGYDSNGVSVEEQDVLQMHYEANPAYSALAYYLSGQQMHLWDSFVFSTGCEALQGRLDQFLPTCAGVLASFQPGNGFLMDAIAQYIHQQAQQVQAVGGTVAQIGQLQAESAALQQNTTFNVGVGWANALGGQVDLRNPNNGDVYHVDDRFGAYCLDQDGYLIGGTDQFDLQDDCATPLERFRPQG
jgi:hypothetical protein